MSGFIELFAAAAAVRLPTTRARSDTTASQTQTQIGRNQTALTLDLTRFWLYLCSRQNATESDLWYFLFRLQAPSFDPNTCIATALAAPARWSYLLEDVA